MIAIFNNYEKKIQKSETVFVVPFAVDITQFSGVFSHAKRHIVGWYPPENCSGF